MKKRVLEFVKAINEECCLNEGDCLVGEDGCQQINICSQVFKNNIKPCEHEVFELYNFIMEEEDEEENKEFKKSGFRDKNGREIIEGDTIIFPNGTKGVVKFGAYKTVCKGINTYHTGFYIEFERTELNKDSYREILRKNLGYWLNGSKVIDNV